MSDRPAGFPKIISCRTIAELNNRFAALGLAVRGESELRTGPDAPLAQPVRIGPLTLANRWCAQPMEGWDGTPDGRPTSWTRRRWRHFGQSGAKLVWGGEAVAVRPDGRSHPRQLMLSERTARDLRDLRELLADEHSKACGQTNGLAVGLQLSHAGRFARSNGRPEPRILYHHPILDGRLGINQDHPVVTDDWIEELIDCFIAAGELAAQAGFDLVDIRHCHGCLGHEFLSAHTRPGPYGGSFENRTRFLRRVVEGIRRRAPGLLIGVRLSAFDTVPYEGGPEAPGRPCPFSHLLPYRWGFGLNRNNPLEIDLDEPVRLVRLCNNLGVSVVNVSAGGSDYNPHVQRPSAHPARGDYRPPEDPLLGVARLISVTAELKAACPEMVFVGSGYSYLQDYAGHVAQWAVATGKTDLVGLGRMLLSYWEFPGDVLSGRPIQRGRICRTFSDCTSGPRAGLVSGCFRSDDLYGTSEQGRRLRAAKRQANGCPVHSACPV